MCVNVHSAVANCPRDLGAAARANRCIGPESTDIGLWLEHLPLQGLCFDCHAAVPLALQLLPQHALNQTNDWMAEIYERWTAAHAVLIVSPVYWYQSPSVLKLMIDRMVCADGGNPDPTATSGKKAGNAKELELAGWDYPQRLAGRVYGLVVHGDVAGLDGSRRALSDWLDWMGLQDAGSLAVAKLREAQLEPPKHALSRPRPK
jgi:multimeric flavodoxin WrbA